MFKGIVVLAALGMATLLTSAPAYAGLDQFAQIGILPLGRDLDLKISNVHQTWGHWERSPTDGSQLSNDDVEATPCKDGHGAWVIARGNDSAAVGCDGYFELLDGDTKVCAVHFISPFSGTNTWEVADKNPKYRIDVFFNGNSASRDGSSGPLGKVNIQVRRL